MKEPKDIERFYDERLKEDFGQLEGRRKKVYRNVLILGVVLGALLLLVIVRFWAEFMQEPVLFILLLFFPAFGLLGYQIFKKGYSREFREKVIPHIVKFIDKNMEYNSKGFISQSLFFESRLFPTVNRYKGEDFVRGRIGDTEFMFSEVCAERVSRRSDRRRSTTTIFEGLFFVADFNKDFNGVTMVEPQVFEAGDLAHKKGVGDVVKVDDPEFEQEFNVYGSDQVEARYILSTSLMQRILDYKRKTGQVMFLSFVNSKVFIAIPWQEYLFKTEGEDPRKRFNVSVRKNFFEPTVFSPLDGLEMTKEYIEDIQTVLDIIEDLNLNLRIWTKR